MKAIIVLFVVAAIFELGTAELRKEEVGPMVRFIETRPYSEISTKNTAEEVKFDCGTPFFFILPAYQTNETLWCADEIVEINSLLLLDANNFGEYSDHRCCKEFVKSGPVQTFSLLARNEGKVSFTLSNKNSAMERVGEYKLTVTVAACKNKQQVA